MISASPEREDLARRKMLPAFLVAGTWLSISALVLFLPLRYDFTPGRPADPEQAPSCAAPSTQSGEWTLAIFLHPHCPCSVTSLNRAAELAARFSTLRLEIYLVRPPGCPEGWEAGRLSQSAGTIPGAHVVIDVDGREARRRGVHTSGQVFLSDASGQVRFRGGLTNSRGNQGDSIGAAAVAELVETGLANVVETAVFGCPLLNDDS